MFKVIRKRFSTSGGGYNNIPWMRAPNFNDFETILRGNHMCADKSLLIKDVLKEKVILFTRPRRWGKSINLRMLKSFFQPKFTSTGDMIVDKEKKEKFSKLFIGSLALSSNPITLEAKKTPIIDLQGTIPVVFLTMPSCLLADSESELDKEFKKYIKVIFKDHHYILKSNKVPHNSKMLFEKYIIGGIRSLSSKNIVETLKLFLMALYQHHDKKPILLVDEYNSPLVYLKREKPHLYQYGFELYKKMFSFIKDDSNLLQFSLFTGVTRLGKESIFSGVKDFRHDSVLNSKYEHFGLNQNEVDDLVDTAFILSNKKFNKAEVKKSICAWHGGYKINNNIIYNPFSTMNCLHSLIRNSTLDYQNFFQNTFHPGLMVNSLKTVTTDDYLEQLLCRQEAIFTPEDENNVENISINEKDLLITMMDYGYITKGDKEGVVKIPNREVKKDFYDKLYWPWIEKIENNILKVVIHRNEFDNQELFLKVFQEKILRFCKQKYYYLSYFKTLIYTSLQQQNLFVILEKKTKDNEGVDLVISSADDMDIKNDTLYIIEVMNQFNYNKKSVVNAGFAEIFKKNYAGKELDLNIDLKTFILRVVYFQYKKNSEWGISMAELRFTRENLVKVIQSFEEKEDNKRENIFEELLEFSSTSFMS